MPDLATMHNLGMNSAQTKSAMRGANMENFNPILNGRSIRPPLRTIYIFSTAKRAFDVKHPLFPKLTLRGCENGERYVRCTSIPDPIAQACPDQERGGTRTDEHDGWMAAIDMLTPGNFTMNPYNGDSNPNFYANTSGTNLIAEGLFPSLNEEPTEAEIAKAEDARDKHFRYLAKEAQRLFAVSTKKGNEFLQSYPDTTIAMDALQIDSNWHSLNVVKVACPNCGDLLKKGVAFHQSSAGVLCVIDPQKAWKAGAISKERYLELTEPDEPEKKDGRVKARV